MLGDMTVPPSHRRAVAARAPYDDAPPATRGPVAHTLIVTDEGAAEALTDPRSLRLLPPFLGRAMSVGEAARETGEKANTTLRRVQRFVRLGLLEGRVQGG